MSKMTLEVLKVIITYRKVKIVILKKLLFFFNSLHLKTMFAYYKMNITTEQNGTKQNRIESSFHCLNIL